MKKFPSKIVGMFYTEIARTLANGQKITGGLYVRPHSFSFTHRVSDYKLSDVQSNYTLVLLYIGKFMCNSRTDTYTYKHNCTCRNNDCLLCFDCNRFRSAL